MGRQFDVSLIVGLKDQASLGLQRLRATANRTFTELGRMASWSMGRIERGLAIAGRRAMWAQAILGGTVAYGLRAAINAFANYEQGIRNAVTVTGLVGRAADEAEEAMFRLGLQLLRTSTVGGQQISQVFYELASAGLSVKDSMQAARGVIALSEGTLSDLGAAAQLITSQLAAFGMGTEETDRLVNVLAATTMATLMKMEDLATALPYVGAVARAMGLDVETTAAALGLLQNNGLDASMAGTSLRMALTGLARQTPAGIRTLQKYGLSLKDLDVSAHGLFEVLERLRRAQISYADAVGLFGVRGVLAYSILTRQLGALIALKRAITGTNMAYQMQARQLVTMQGRWKLLRSTVEDAAIRLGRGLAPAVRRLLEVFAQIVGRAADLGVFERWAARLGAILDGLSRWVAGAGGARFAAAMRAMFGRIGAWLGEFGRRLAGDWRAIMANLAAGVSGLYSWLTGGGGFPAEALGGLARAVAQGVRDALQQVLASLQGSAIWQEMGRLIAQAFSLTPAEAEAVVAEWRAILAEVGRNLLSILQALRAALPHILAGIGRILQWAGEHPTITQVGILLVLFQKLTGLLPLVATLLGRVGLWLLRITGVTKWLAQAVPALGRALLPVLGKIGTKVLGIVGALISVWDIIRTIIAAVGAWRAGREAAAKGRQVQELLGTSGRLQDVLEAPITPEQLRHARGALGLVAAGGGAGAQREVRAQVLQYRPAAVPAPVSGGRTGPTNVAVSVHLEAPVYGVDDLEAKVSAIASRQVRAALAGVV
mgnify:CR=1 FL=1